MLVFHFLIIFQQLDGMPAHGRMRRIMRLHHNLQLGNFILDFFRILQNILCILLLFIMVQHGMKQDIKPCPLCRGHRHHRNISQHFRQTVQINFHAPFLHNIHHV